MKFALVASVLGLILFAAPSAEAQTRGRAPAAAPAAGGNTAKGYQKVKNYDFEADSISGELVKPEGEFSTARKFAEHSSLIRPRLDFIKEIVKSAEDL
jgi:hypothetical protein